MDKRLLTVIVMAVTVALIITAIFYQITVGRKPLQADVPTRELVVAKVDLPMGSVIGEDDVRVMDYPEQAFPKGGFSAIEDVLDRSVIDRVLANEPVLSGRVTEKGAGFGLAPLIPEGERAMALAVNQVSGVSGFVLPGSKVDVLLTASLPGVTNERITVTVMENLTVLSTGSRQEPDARGQPQNVPVVNVLVTPEKAELLTLAAREGTIQLVLRNPVDTEIVSEHRPGTRTRDLFAKSRPKKRPVVRFRRSGPAVVAVPLPPPPPRQVELILGNQKNIVTLASVPPR